MPSLSNRHGYSANGWAGAASSRLDRLPGGDRLARYRQRCPAHGASIQRMAGMELVVAIGAMPRVVAAIAWLAIGSEFAGAAHVTRAR